MTFNVSKFDRMALRDALRMGIQGAVAASLVYIVMQSLGLQEKFVGILSAVLILSRTPDGSLGAGIDRISSTLVGSVIGIICLILLPYGWGTAVSLAVTMFVLNGIAALRPAWSYGVVAAVALSLGAEQDAVQVAMQRGLGIAVGVTIGMLVSLIVWPEFSRRRFERHRHRALSALVDRLGQVSEATISDTDPVNDESDHRYHKAISDAQAALDTTRFGGDSSRQEELDRIRRIYSSVIVLDRALEDGWNAGDVPHDMLAAVAEAISDIAKGEKPQTDGLVVDIDPAQGSDDAHDRLRLSAVAFGLKELVSETKKLADGTA